MSQIKIPELSLVVLVGISGSGKSTFAARHFRPTEVISSDFCRALVSDDENDQAVTADAFDVLNFIAGKRLDAGRLTVIDATSVQPAARQSLIALARAHHVLAVAIVLDVPERTCAERNATRQDRSFGGHVLRQQRDQLRRSLRGLRREGFHRVYVLDGEEQIAAAAIEREPLWNDRRAEHGPFDIIGDVHGCYDELAAAAGAGWATRSPRGRRLGGASRGPHGGLRRRPGRPRPGHAGRAPAGHGHDRGRHGLLRVRQPRGQAGARAARPERHVSHGLAESLAQLAAEPPEFAAQAAAFMDELLGHVVLDDGKLVVAHAGMPEAMHGRASAAVRAFALYGDTTGETDEFGLPVRYPWAAGLPRPGHGRLRPHAGAGARLGQPHHQHRHRLRVRREAHRAALPERETGQRAGRPGVLRQPARPPGGPAGQACGRGPSRRRRD